MSERMRGVCFWSKYFQCSVGYFDIGNVLSLIDFLSFFFVCTMILCLFF